MTAFGQMCWRGVSGAPKGRKMGAFRGGALSCFWEVRLRRGGRLKISRFPFSFFLSCGCLLVEFWWCLRRRDPQMCTLNPGGPKAAGPIGQTSICFCDDGGRMFKGEPRGRVGEREETSLRSQSSHCSNDGEWQGSEGHWRRRSGTPGGLQWPCR